MPLPKLYNKLTLILTKLFMHFSTTTKDAGMFVTLNEKKNSQFRVTVQFIVT